MASIALIFIGVGVGIFFFSPANTQEPSTEAGIIISEPISSRVKMIPYSEWKPESRSQTLNKPIVAHNENIDHSTSSKATHDTDLEKVSSPHPIRDEEVKLPEDLEQLINQSLAGLEVQYKEDGTAYIRLQGRQQYYVITKIGKDGAIIPQCIDHPVQLKETQVEGEAVQ